MGQRNVTKLLANLAKTHNFLCQFQNWVKVITLFNLKIEEPENPEMKLVFNEMRAYLKDIVDLYFESRRKMIRMFERTKTINGRKYRYLVKCERFGETVRQKVIKYLGPVDPIYKKK